MPQLASRSGSIIEVSAGELRQQMGGQLDLCSGCGRLYRDWVSSGHQANHERIGQALADTAVASMALGRNVAMVVAIPADCSQGSQALRNSNMAEKLDALGDGRSAESVVELSCFLRRLQDPQFLIVESMR
jgi:hypothetical protein